MSGRLRWRGFRAESADSYTGVLIPLDQAHRHSHSARCGRTEYEGSPDDNVAYEEDDDSLKDQAGVDVEGTGMLEMSAAEYSIEGLRREVQRGEDGARTDYESRFMHPRLPSRS